MHLLWQTAQKHTQQQLGRELGRHVCVWPEGQNVVHQNGQFLSTKRRKVKQIIDLLLLSGAISPAEALLKLLVQIGK